MLNAKGAFFDRIIFLGGGELAGLMEKSAGFLEEVAGLRRKSAGFFKEPAGLERKSAGFLEESAGLRMISAISKRIGWIRAEIGLIFDKSSKFKQRIEEKLHKLRRY